MVAKSFSTCLRVCQLAIPGIEAIDRFLAFKTKPSNEHLSHNVTWIADGHSIATIKRSRWFDPTALSLRLFILALSLLH